MADGLQGELVVLIAEIAIASVDAPEQVMVQARQKDCEISLELRVAPGDIGEIVGKRGRTAQSIRSILHAYGKKTQKRILFTTDEQCGEFLKRSEPE